MDDCFSGTVSPAENLVEADQIQSAVSAGGFAVKGFVFSGEDPPKDLEHGDGFVLIGGLK